MYQIILAYYWKSYFFNIVARTVASMQRVNIRQFLSNGSVSTFPRKRILTQQWSYFWKLGVFGVVRAEML
jgi:hypothetical protein